MGSHRVSPKVAPRTVRVGGIEFENNFYDRDVDVLYLHVGDPAGAVDFDGTAEGDGTSYGPDGSLVGITILDELGALTKPLPLHPGQSGMVIAIGPDQIASTTFRARTRSRRSTRSCSRARCSTRSVA